MKTNHPIVSIELRAEPRPIILAPNETVLIVVDMQNDFAAKGGVFDRVGIDIGGIEKIVAPTARAVAAARSAGIGIIHLKMGYLPDLSDLGPEGSKNWLVHHPIGVGQTMTAPNGNQSRILVRDTWNTEVIDVLKPQPGDVEIYKTRFSGFYQTNLDAILQQRGVKTLIVTGCTTSVCVESTIRDAMFLNYSSVLLADCTAEPIGSGLTRSNYDASLLLIQILFGSVSNSDDFIKSIGLLR
jgi:ureidoacrylate peracid hydrolase